MKHLQQLIMFNNNIQQNDNSQNTNKTEYGSSTIGTSNPDTLVKETSMILLINIAYGISTF